MARGSFSSIALLAVACRGPSSTSMPDAAPSQLVTATASASSTALPEAPEDRAEADYEGSFNGAKLYATIAVARGKVSGTLFYAAVGTDLALGGSLAAATLTLHELDAKGNPISETTLAPAAGGWSGTWTKGDKSGPASLRRIDHEPGEPAMIVDRRWVALTEACSAPTNVGQFQGRARDDILAPVVLGLRDREFQRKLDAKLFAMARRDLPTCPLGVEVGYRVVLNQAERLSILYDAAFRIGGETPSADPRTSRLDPHESTGYSAGINVDIEHAHIVASNDEIVTKVGLRKAVGPTISRTNATCVAEQGDPLDALDAFAVTPSGAEFCFHGCAGRTGFPVCDRVPSSKLAPSLVPGSAFAGLWTAGHDQ